MSSAVAKMGNRFATIQMGRKVGGIAEMETVDRRRFEFCQQKQHSGKLYSVDNRQRTCIYNRPAAQNETNIAGWNWDAGFSFDWIEMRLVII